MDRLTSDTFTNILYYALDTSNESSPTLISSSPSSQKVDIRTAMSWVANLRLVHRSWRSLIDEEENLIWFSVAQILGLGPPQQLYANGTYRGVCENLLICELEKQLAQFQVDQALRQWEMQTLCMPPTLPPHFQDHPNPEKHGVIKFSEAVKKRIIANILTLERFLRCVNFTVMVGANTRNGHDNLKTRWNSALIRYRMFLCLKLKYPNVFLVPTVDIEFCWLTHIFRTEKYWKDLTTLGVDPHHSIRLTSYGETAALLSAVKGTAELWESEFGTAYPYLVEDTDIALSREVWTAISPGNRKAKVIRIDDNFFPKMGAITSALPPSLSIPDVSLTVEEILADLQWFPALQDAINEMKSKKIQVLRSDYFDEAEFEQLVFQNIIPSYERFLTLCANNSTIDPKKLSPPIIIDLAWHAHQLEPVLYRNECKSYFEREIWHDIWPNGLGVVSKMSTDLACLWKMTYGTPIEDDWSFFMSYPEYEMKMNFLQQLEIDSDDDL